MMARSPGQEGEGKQAYQIIRSVHYPQKILLVICVLPLLQTLVLQACVFNPLQGSPSHSKCLVLVPPPQGLVQSVQDDQIAPKINIFKNTQLIKI